MPDFSEILRKSLALVNDGFQEAKEDINDVVTQ